MILSAFAVFSLCGAATAGTHFKLTTSFKEVSVKTGQPAVIEFKKQSKPVAAHIQTIVMRCYQNLELDAVPPDKKNPKVILFCANGSGVYGSANMQDITIPAQWTLRATAGGTNSNPQDNAVYLTYDLGD